MMTARLDTVRQLVAEGYKQQEIASLLGLKSTKQVRRLMDQAGLGKAPHLVLSDHDKDEIVRLSRDEGWPPEEISATLGIKYTTVLIHVVPGAGLEWRNTAARLARKHERLFAELRRGINERKEYA